MRGSTKRPETVPAALPPVLAAGPQLVAFIDQIRVAASEPVCDVFHRRTQLADRIPGWNRTVIARARQASTCNPEFRLALMLVAARLGGLPRSAGDRLIGFQETVRDMLWPVDQVCFGEAMRAEQRLDAAEDVSQIDYLEARNTDDLAEWLNRAEQYRAQLSATIAVGRMHLIATHSRAA